MWSELLPNGKVKFVERYEHPLTGQLLRVSITLDKETASTRKQAQKALNLKIEKKLRELCPVVKKNELRFSELVELYRKDQEATVAKSTYRRNYFATKSLIRIIGENTLVERLSAGYIRERFTELNEKPGTTNERITRLKALMRWDMQTTTYLISAGLIKSRNSKMMKKSTSLKKNILKVKS